MPASEFFVALTITMTRIVLLLSVREDGAASTGRARLPSEVATNGAGPDLHVSVLFFAARRSFHESAGYSRDYDTAVATLGRFSTPPTRTAVRTCTWPS
jgi:hypothetical protein